LYAFKTTWIEFYNNITTKHHYIIPNTFHNFITGTEHNYCTNISVI
jgi:hypothetical protein